MKAEYRMGLDQAPGPVELRNISDDLVMLRWNRGKQIVVWQAARSDVTVEIEQVSGAWQESRSFRRGILRSGKKHRSACSIALKTSGQTVVLYAEISPAEIRAELAV